MIKRALPLLALASFVALTNMTAHAQSKGDQALLDALVRKGVLTEKEAESITADIAKESAPVPTTKIQVGDWVKELKLSGDLRIRNQWDERDPMLLTNRRLGPQDPHIQRDRWRFRLRLNADFKLAGNFFGGVQLATSDNRASDTKNATYTGGYDNYNIFISRAFLGWSPQPGLTFVAGKQANPFYTTDLIYDPEVDPTGLVERIDFDKLFNLTFGEPVVGEGKEGKAPPPALAPGPGNSLELALIAGQFIFFDNNEDSGNTQLKWDAYQFQQQLLARLHIGDMLTLTWAPGFIIDNDAAVGATAVDARGNLVPPTNTSFNGGQPLNNSQPFPITQRDLFVLLSPGDITYKVFGKPLTFYWDFAYNLEGNDRFNKDYGPLFSHYFFVGRSATPSFSGRVKPSFSDNLAWLVGLKFGENKKQGDFSISADYRQVGISSIDPNLNSSNFALSNLNVEGWEFNVAYNLTDFLTASLTFYYSDALTKNLYGGFATGNVPGVASNQQWPIARDRHDKVIQANLLMKF
jgi:Putative porin